MSLTKTNGMKSIKILSPINSINDFDILTGTTCRSVYVYHSVIFENDKFDLLEKFNNRAKQLDIEFYISFKSVIREVEILKVQHFLDYLIKNPVNGILINSIDILELIKKRKLPFKVFIDSGLNIHNLSGIEFVNLFHLADSINITEEIYLKNLVKIKKYSRCNLAIDSDNLPWIAENILKSKSVDMITIKGDFETPEELIESVNFVQNILENPKFYRNKKLPFKNYESPYYKTNHFSGEFISTESKNFKFAGNIKQFNWKFNKFKPRKMALPVNNDIPKLNLRLTSLEQIKELKSYIKKSRYNPVYSIEYGEIINTADLAKYSFNKIIDKIKKDCDQFNINLQLSTPRILIERDFDRVYEYVKLLCIKKPYPQSIIINNIGYWNTIINDSDFNNINIELGQGLNLLNSVSISCLANQRNISTVDLSNCKSIENIKLCIERIKDFVPVRKLTIAGNIRIPSSGLCPLNTDSAILSRLSCSAPCHQGNYSITDPSTNKSFPIAVDGFCRLHLFKSEILDLFKYLRFFETIGINEFVIDFNGLPSCLVPVLLNRFVYAIGSHEYIDDPCFINNHYGIEKIL